MNLAVNSVNSAAFSARALGPWVGRRQPGPFVQDGEDDDGSENPKPQFWVLGADSTGRPRFHVYAVTESGVGCWRLWLAFVLLAIRRDGKKAVMRRRSKRLLTIYINTERR